MFVTILADPATGHVLGELPETGPIRTLQDLHFDLLAGRTGRVVNGVGALCLLTMCATGVVIWWPGVQRLRRVFVVDVRRRWRAVIRDLHNATGIWTVIFIAMWAITGAAFIFPSAFRALVASVSPLTIARPPTSHPVPGSLPRSLDQLIARARRQAPDQHIARVVIPSRDTDPFLVMFSATAPTPAGDATLAPVYVDQFSGEVLRDAPRSQRTAGDVVMAWTAPLHVGNFTGTGVKIVWTMFGLAPLLLFVTGATMWWTRSRATKNTED